MAAPKGNKFWKNRSKHGRDKLFATPALLWSSVCEYFDWCDNNPWHKHEALKSGTGAGTIIGIPATRPYTYSGLCLYLGCSESFFRMARKRAGEAEDVELLAVLDAIDNAIRTQQFEGATLGMFSINMIARSLGIKEQTPFETEYEVKTDININVIMGNAPLLSTHEDEVAD